MHYRTLALGILAMSAGNMFSRFVMPVNDFVLGCINGIGLGMMILAMIRMRKESAH